MLGIEMMMKALGLEPAHIIKTVENIGSMATALQQQLNRIEATQIQILNRLDNLEGIEKTETLMLPVIHKEDKENV
jgi:prefoldin subunit 5